ncbi:MAG: hypothetical protein HC903_01040 [Methylacidiphilales bacterium]|nr:hypothetical protein [Candidatus Methylacidiphilales bacterium]NJR16500.1 hypothetical protein [Calothrix sp. CSU_2_0]
MYLTDLKTAIVVNQKIAASTQNQDVNLWLVRSRKFSKYSNFVVLADVRSLTYTSIAISWLLNMSNFWNVKPFIGILC